jgi:hypothetical protein
MDFQDIVAFSGLRWHRTGSGGGAVVNFAMNKMRGIS